MESGLEFDEMCRCCLKSVEGSFKNVMDKAENENLTYSEMFEAVSRHSVDPAEPQKFCLSCTDRILEAFELRQLCDETQKLLEAKIKEIQSVKVEFLDTSVNYCDSDASSPVPKKQKKSKKLPKDPKNSKKLCPICGIFRSTKHIQEHIDRATNVDNNGKVIARPFTCDLCGRQTASRNNMFLHMQSMHLRVTLKCKYCKAEFKNRGRRETHMRKFHTEIKGLLECKFCEFRAVDASTMHVHLKKHTGQKPHRCEICHHEFITKTKWRDHLATHSDARPFSCETCAATFKTRKTLNSHKKIHLEHDYECPVCKHTYQTSHQLRIHVTKNHKEYPLPPPGTVLSKSWRKRKAEQELRDEAIKQGKDQREIEGIKVWEAPPIESKQYFQGFG